MKKTKYTKEQFKTYRILMILSIIFYFLTRCIVMISEVVTIDEKIGIYFYLWDMGMPVLIFLIGYMCINSYWKMVFPDGDQMVDRSIGKRVKRSIITLIGMGTIFFYCSLGFVVYLFWYREYLSKLWDCIILLIFIEGCWIGGVADCIKRWKYNVYQNIKKRTITRIFGGLVLLLITVLVFLYAIDQGETEYFQRLREEYERNHIS